MPLSEICCKLIATFSRTRTVGRWLVEQPRTFHTSPFSRFLDARDKDHASKEKRLVVHQGEYFDEAAKTSKNKKTFLEVVQFYLKKNASYRLVYMLLEFWFVHDLLWVVIRIKSVSSNE